MTVEAWLTLVACAAQGMLALVTLRARGPMAAPLRWMTVDLVVWSFASFAHDYSGEPGWRVLDVALSPFTPALGLHFVVAFVGRRQEFRRLLAAQYVYFACIAACAPLAWFAPAHFLAPEGPAWSALFLGGVGLAVAFVTWILATHHRTCDSDEERARARSLLLALPLGAAFGSTDLIHLLVPAVPGLSAFGTLGCALVMTTVAVRLRLFGRDLSTATALAAAPCAAIAILAYFVSFEAFATNVALTLVASTAITFAVVAATRELVAASAERRRRLERLALAGRFSAQLAHDFKNPLTALKGAVQFLVEERRRGRSIDGHAEFLDLMTEQIERLERVADDYQRLGGAQLLRGRMDVAELVRSVSALAPFAGDGIDVWIDAAGPLPTLGDADLLSRALDNLLRNAVEAMPTGGKLTVRAARMDPADPASDVKVTVEDTGTGMDARTRERAFEDFFTTKATGSGLGLAFVRRVAEAHGGSVHLGMAGGRGTVVELRLPGLSSRAEGA